MIRRGEVGLRTEGICSVCSKWSLLTKHHFFGVEDMAVIYPEINIHELDRLEQERRGNDRRKDWSGIILVCRPCHDELERTKHRVFNQIAKKRETNVKDVHNAVGGIADKYKRRYEKYWRENNE